MSNSIYFTKNKEKLNLMSLLVFVVFLAIIAIFNLTITFISALASFYIVKSLQTAPLISKHEKAKRIATMLIGFFLIFVLVIGGVYSTELAKSSITMYSSLKGNVAPIIISFKSMLPSGISSLIPTNEDVLNKWGHEVVTTQSGAVLKAGASLAEGLLMSIIGIIIGLMIANADESPRNKTLFSMSLSSRILNFYEIFKKVVLAQFWIALINTFLTSIFILILLPLFGIKLPYAAALIAFTFVAGLIPIVGNLACNVVLTLAGLSKGLPAAIACLVWLMAIHKLEYFINAKVLGSKTSIATWELLSVIFISHAIMGVVGLVLGPLYYSYIKLELKNSNIL